MFRFTSFRPAFRRTIDVTLGVVAGAALAAATLGRDMPTHADAAPEPRAGRPALQARALGVIDGDTFDARVTAFPGQEIVARIRIAGLDAPERNGRCASEANAARAATQALVRLVENRALTLTDARGDKYFGRVVARVSTQAAGDVAEALIAEGHGRAYSGGRRGGWC